MHLVRISWAKLRGYLRYRDNIEEPELSDLGDGGTGSTLGFGSAVVGNLLEDFVFYLLSMVRGFECIKGGPGPLGQMDILVRNESSSIFWRHAGMFFAVECKNRLANTGGDVIDKLVSFARRRSGTVKLVMLFHSARRLTYPAQSRLLAEGLGSVSFIEFNRDRIDRMMKNIRFEDPQALASSINDRLKEALTSYVLASDFSRR